MVLHAGWDDIARSFREFYSNASNRVDIRGLKHFDRYDEIPDSKWVSLAKRILSIFWSKDLRGSSVRMMMDSICPKIWPLIWI